MTDNIVYGVDFKANNSAIAVPDVADQLLILPVVCGLRSEVDTAPCETNPTPFVAPEWDGA